MHPDVAASCVLAAQTVGLDIAGVDLVTSDLALTLHASGGAILEVVARPSLREYMRPLSSRPRPVGEAVVEHLFGVEEAIDCTVAAVSGTAGKTNVVGLLSAMAGAASKRVGVADSHRLTIAGRTIGQGDQTHFDAARRVLTNPFVDTAILEVDESNVLDAGIAFGRCDVAIVTNLGQGDHLGRKYVEQLVTIRKAVRAPADVVVPSGYAVLNADDPEVITMDERCRGKLMYFSKRGISAPVRELVNKGGRAVVAVEDRVVYLDGGRTEELFTLQRFACPVLGLPPMLLENLLAATAGAIALGLPRNAIVQGLERALGNDGIALFERDKRMVLVTPSRSLIALGEWAAWLAKRFPSARRLALFEAPTDWRADDVASAENVLFSQFFSVGLVRSSAGNTPSDAVAAGRSTAPADLSTFETLDAALVDQISRLGPEDLLFVPPVSSDQYRRLVSQLVEFGFGRRKTGGLASVESCR
jgi:cyanophycin synthetase